MLLKYLFIIFFVIKLSYQKQSTPESPTYVAGVVEFNPAPSSFSNILRLERNLIEYLKIIESSEAEPVDILVFPESTLNNYETTSYVPDPNNRIAPCDASDEIYEEFLVKLSCAVRRVAKYVLINLTEKSDCTAESQMEIGDTRPCANNGLNLYNSNIVFDRTGIIISRYRKINLFSEYAINNTLHSEIGEFTTDFGVTFGHFICFDIIFFKPSMVVLQAGITDIILSLMWFSQLPFLTAVQIQQNWAYANNVNLLSAGANNPSVGSTGSGIYAGNQGAVTALMSSTNQTKLLVATVQKQRTLATLTVDERNIISDTPEEMLNLRLKREYLSIYKIEFLNTEDNLIEKQLCFGRLCCHFYFDITKNLVLDGQISYKYALTIFDDVRIFDGHIPAGSSVCGLIACTDNTNTSSCGLRFNSHVNLVNEINFNEIIITGSFESNKEKILMLPTAVDTSILPLSPNEFDYSESEEYLSDNLLLKNIILRLTVPRDNLLSFAIYGRNFNRDEKDNTEGKANKYAFTKLFIVIIFIILLF